MIVTALVPEGNMPLTPCRKLFTTLLRGYPGVLKERAEARRRAELREERRRATFLGHQEGTETAKKNRIKKAPLIGAFLKNSDYYF